MFSGWSLPSLSLLFLGAALVVWVASIHLSTGATLLADRWRLGQALAGLLLLATIEDLPEVVIVVSGTLAGHLGLVSGNLLGGIATQTVLLVAIDALGVPDRPLSSRAASLPLVLLGLQGPLLFGLVLLTSGWGRPGCCAKRRRVSPGGKTPWPRCRRRSNAPSTRR